LNFSQWFVAEQIAKIKLCCYRRFLMRTPRLRRTCACLISLFVLAASTLLAQSTGGRFAGKVTDASGAVLPEVSVTLINESSGVSRASTTNADGDYSFPEVPVGTYRIECDLAGFKKSTQSNVLLQLNQVLTLNMTLQIGERKDVVEVTTEAPIVDTTSTQLGAVINDRSIAQLPLNARNTYQFLSLQPGVQSTVGADLYAGSSDAGSVSVNGGRGRANNFSVNGGDANDLFVNTPTINPSPDAVEEFRVLTNAFDAEFGRNSGSVINVVTKSGGNKFHGNAYDFLRNKVLNSKNYFDLDKSKYIQNQFGATLGGPIHKDKTFFFASFEGNRVRKGISGGDVTVPTDLERTGDFSAGSAFAGTLQDQFVADILNNRGTGGTGCAGAIAGLGGTSPASGVAWASIFPTNVIPSECQDPVAIDLLQQFVPKANVGANTYLTTITGNNTSNQGTLKFDHRINDKQNFSAYYYVQDQADFDPYNFFQAAGANVPGFGGNNATRDQQINLSHAWTISNTLVNEARVVYMREGQRTLNHPQRTNNVVDSCTQAAAQFCFTGNTDAPGAFTANGLAASDPKYGITPGLGPGREGVPDINVSGSFVIGNNFEGELPQVGNSFQFTDGVTLVKGAHTIKFGGDVRRMRFDQFLYFENSGYFQYFGGGTNDLVGDNLFPNYLLGLPDQYQQGAAQQEHIRTSSFYLFAQDSWKLAKHLTLNYGLRWELNTPQKDIGRRVQTFRPGQISSRYPCLSTAVNDCASAFPTGLVYPGDPGVPAGLTTTYNKAFAPRLGIAWDPKGDGKTSVRAGWGLFYNPIEQLVLEQFSAEPPFGISLTTFNTMFNTPYVSQSGGVLANGANGVLDPKPGTAVDWSLFEPILLFGEFQPHMRTQYAAQYNLTIQHEIARGTQLQLGYVGSQSHRLLASYDINAANPTTCLDINSIPGQSCGSFGEDSQYQFTVPAGFVGVDGKDFQLPNGTTVPGGTTLNLVGLRPFSSPNCVPTTGVGCPPSGAPVFSNIFAENTIGASNYNSFQASLDKRFGKGFQTQIAYTWSKSIDQASSFEDFLDTANPRRTRALSLFDARHRLVASYYWELPIPKYAGAAGKLLNGWALSGITQFQSGFPIRIFSYGDENLIGNSAGFSSPTFPDLVGKFHRIDPKKNGGYYFQPLVDIQDPTQANPNSQFAAQAPGTQGNSPRTVCCGPGLDNTDFSIQKNTSINERFRTEFRLDIFNAFNHTKFENPDGIFSDGSNFGLIQRAADPRLMQVALKLFF
jgi:outer membrane receptor protein involved in Fe transport